MSYLRGKVDWTEKIYSPGVIVDLIIVKLSKNVMPTFNMETMIASIIFSAIKIGTMCTQSICYSFYAILYLARNLCSFQQGLTLKMPRKPASENVVCLCRLLNILANFSNLICIQANSVDPDQTAPWGAVWSGSTLFAKMSFKITSRWQSRRQLLWNLKLATCK